MSKPSIDITTVIDEFPQSEYIKLEKSIITTLVKEALAMNFYHQATKYIDNFIYDNYYPRCDNQSIIVDYYNVFLHNLYKWEDNQFSKIFLATHTKREREEAAKICAEKWSHLLFKDTNQDNGDYQTETSFKLNLLGSMLKETSMNKINEDNIKKFKKNCFNFYNNNRWKFTTLSCDYGPNKNLYDILKQSDIDDSVIFDICPWKTDITINLPDNSVEIRHYKDVTYC